VPASRLTCVNLPKVITCALPAAIAPSQNNNAAQYMRGSGHAGSYYQSEGQTQGQRSQSVVRTMSANTAHDKYFGNDCRFGNRSVASKWKSGHLWPRCGNAKECRPLGAGPAGLKPGDLLNGCTALKNRSSTVPLQRSGPRVLRPVAGIDRRAEESGRFDQSSEVVC
jgi:hypothetical protein